MSRFVFVPLIVCQPNQRECSTLGTPNPRCRTEAAVRLLKFTLLQGTRGLPPSDSWHLRRPKSQKKRPRSEEDALRRWAGLLRGCTREVPALRYAESRQHAESA